MAEYSESPLKQAEQTEELIRAVAMLLLPKLGEFSTTVEVTNRVYERYFPGNLH